MGAVKFEVYMGADSKYHFKLFGRDGKEVATSQGFQHKDGCMEGVRAVKENARSAENFQKKKLDGDKQAFVLRMPNRTVVLEGGPYDTAEACDQAMAEVRISDQAAVVERI